MLKIIFGAIILILSVIFSIVLFVWWLFASFDYWWNQWLIFATILFIMGMGIVTAAVLFESGFRDRRADQNNNVSTRNR